MQHNAAFAGSLHQTISRIGYQRCACIADQCNRFTAGAFDNCQTRRLARVIIISNQWFMSDQTLQQLARHPRIFAGDSIAFTQYIDRTERYIAKIANRRGDDVQPRMKRFR